MAKYIDADKLAEKITRIRDKQSTDSQTNWYDAYDDFKDLVEEFPTTEVIQCKDCVYYEIWELKKDGTEDRRYKPKVCILYARLHDKNWYCADAIRKEGDAK